MKRSNKNLIFLNVENNENGNLTEAAENSLCQVSIRKACPGSLTKKRSVFYIQVYSTYMRLEESLDDIMAHSEDFAGGSSNLSSYLVSPRQIGGRHFLILFQSHS